MKKCINCGREIPDDAVFCGFCGTRQPETENKEETIEEINPESSEENHDVTEAETSEEVNTSEKDETREDETGSVTEEDESNEENPETSASEQETVSETEVVDTPEPEKSDDSEIKDAEIVEPSEEKKSEEENNVSDKSDDADIKAAEIVEPAEEKDSEESNTAEESADTEADDAGEEDDSESEEKETESTDSETKEEEPSSEKKIHKPYIQMKKIEMPKINLSREDFNVLIDMIQNPVEHHGITNATTWIILIFAWIANWVAFGSFSAGFFTLLIILIGMIFLNWLTLKDHATFGETVRNSAEVIFTPSLLVFVGGLFIRNIRAGAEVFAFHSIFTTAFIGLFFLTAALILYLYIVIKKYEMKIWQFVLLMTIFTSLLFWYLMTSGAIALIS